MASESSSAVLRLRHPVAPWTWIKLYRLYLSAFPQVERRSFTFLLKLYVKRKVDIWCIKKAGRFAGLLTTINGEDLVLLDYLAVEEAFRSGGIGSEALKQLQKVYAGKGIFVEIESPYEEAPNQADRKRRKQFYLRNGFVQMNVMAKVFGVNMELIGTNCQMTYEDYRSFYRDNYSEWSVKHISEEVHPASVE